MPDDNIEQIVRIARTDVNGQAAIEEALTSIDGVGHRYADAVAKVSDFDRDTKIGALSRDEREELEEIMRNPDENDIPTFLRNRRKDRETGEDKHIIGADLELTHEFDIRRLKEISSYKGWRHEQGLPVRGQKTQSSFRSGAKVGVSRAEVQAAAEEEAAGDEADEDEGEE